MLVAIEFPGGIWGEAPNEITKSKPLSIFIIIVLKTVSEARVFINFEYKMIRTVI